MGGPGDAGRALVVGAAVIRSGRLLAARRTSPPEVAGRWELPGGKVQAGETAGDALVREVVEELACEVSVERWLDGAQPIGTSYVLRVAVCRLLRDEPRPGVDHDDLRWLGAEELDDLDWLEPNRPFLKELRALLLVSET
jgi:8-oxo-dGTP diphosphatase